MLAHEDIRIGSLVVNRGFTVLVLHVFDEVKNGEPGFDGIQFEHGRYRGRWAYSSESGLVAPAGSPEALQYATAAAVWMVANPNADEWLNEDNWLLDDLADVFPEQVAAARTGK